MLDVQNPMTLEQVLQILDISAHEAEPFMRDWKIPVGRETLAVSDLTRVNTAVERICHQLAGRDWRRADGADREKSLTEVGPYDLFHRKSGLHQALKTFGQLLRWSESEYGWKS